MTDKHIIDGVDVNECNHYKNNGKCCIPHYQQGIKYTCCNCNEWDCYYKQLQREKQNSQEARDTAIKEFNRAEELKTLLKRKEQECERLRFPMPDTNYAILTKEEFEQLDKLKAENEELRRRIIEIFACLIKANRDKIVDTLWVDDITTLWDYIAQTLGIEGDQNQIEEQVEMLYSEGE